MANSEIWNSLTVPLGLVDASFCHSCTITESTFACSLTAGVERKCVDTEKKKKNPGPPLNAFFQGISKYPWNLL